MPTDPRDRPIHDTDDERAARLALTMRAAQNPRENPASELAWIELNYQIAVALIDAQTSAACRQIERLDYLREQQSDPKVIDVGEAGPS